MLRSADQERIEHRRDKGPVDGTAVLSTPASPGRFSRSAPRYSRCDGGDGHSALMALRTVHCTSSDRCHPTKLAGQLRCAALGAKQDPLRREVNDDSVLRAQLLQASLNVWGRHIAFDNGTGIGPDGGIIAYSDVSPQGDIVLCLGL
jgi:hypothetical protein